MYAPIGLAGKSLFRKHQVTQSRATKCRAATEATEDQSIFNWEPKIKSMEEWADYFKEQNQKYDEWKVQNDKKVAIEQSRENLPEGRMYSDLEIQAHIDEVNAFADNPPPKEQPMLLGEAFAFGGKGAELLNARLAMMGWLCIVVGEALFDKNSWELLDTNYHWIAINVVMWGMATLEPMMNGGFWWKDVEGWVFNRQVEMIHGRTCMVALVALFLIEAVTGDCNMRFNPYSL